MQEPLLSHGRRQESSDTATDIARRNLGAFSRDDAAAKMTKGAMKSRSLCIRASPFFPFVLFSSRLLCFLGLRASERTVLTDNEFSCAQTGCATPLVTEGESREIAV